MLTTSRIAAPQVAACLKARTRALTPDESQKTVLLMSATSSVAPWLSTAKGMFTLMAMRPVPSFCELSGGNCDQGSSLPTLK